MLFRSSLLVAAIVSTLAGCSPSVPKNTDGSLLKPTEQEIIFAATNAFRHLKGRDPVNPKIESLKQMNVFITQKEYVACISVEEERMDAVHNVDWTIKHPVGSPFKKHYAMLLRVYDGVWGAGLFKEAHHLNSFGAIKMYEICEE